MVSSAIEKDMGGHEGAAVPPNDFLNRLLDSSKFDEKKPCAGMGLHGLFRLVITEKYKSYIYITPVIG